MSQSWKNLEKWWRDALIKQGLTAIRKVRGADWSAKIDDVGVEEAPWLVSDCKYSIHGFLNNRLLSQISNLLATVEDKYNKTPQHKAILISRGYKERKPVASCDAEFMAELLAFWIKHKDLRSE